MAGEPAIRKVLDRLEAWFTGQLGAGVTLFVDRPLGEAYHDADCPAVNLRCERTAFTVFDHGTMLHEAAIKFDVISGASGTANIDEIQAEIAAKIVARMWAMALDQTPGSIGELLQQYMPIGFGPEQDEFSLSDTGEATFTWSLTYLTPIADFRTIIGATGLVP